MKEIRNYDGPWPKTPGRLVSIVLIRFYQLTLSCFIGHYCRHLPTCSEYTYEAIARHGLWVGSWLGIFRLMRCRPCGTSGFDPVPIVLGNYCTWYTPWRYRRLAVQKNED